MGFITILIALALQLSFLMSLYPQSREEGRLNKTTYPPLVSIKIKGPSPSALALALKAYNWIAEKGEIKKPILTIIDFSQPSYKKRLWVIDMKTEKLLFTGFVAHGKNSGLTTPTRFSNKIASDKTSLGAYLTGGTYKGKHGISLRIDGLETGINNNARARAIVIHAAPYVTPAFIHLHGYAGRSWGCFALNPKYASTVINMVKGGSVIFAYAPDELKDPYFMSKAP